MVENIQNLVQSDIRLRIKNVFNIIRVSEFDIKHLEILFRNASYLCQICSMYFNGQPNGK